jgi:hypothetical protein
MLKCRLSTDQHSWEVGAAAFAWQNPMNDAKNPAHPSLPLHLHNTTNILKEMGDFM